MDMEVHGSSLQGSPENSGGENSTSISRATMGGYYFDHTSYHVFSRRNKTYAFGVHNLDLYEINGHCQHILKTKPPLSVNSILAGSKSRQERQALERAFSCLVEAQMLTNSPPVSVEGLPLYKPQPFSGLVGLYLVVTQDCNLRCRYCSAEYGRFGMDPHERLMSTETVRASLKFLLENLGEDCREPSVAFVGGEPLMNFEAIVFAFDYMKKNCLKKATFFLNTNGTLMTEDQAKWFVQNEVPVRFSIDGPQTVHDTNRVNCAGEGSYAMAMAGLQIYKKYRGNGFSVQTSLPHGKGLANAVRHLWQLGAGSVVANYTGISPFLDNSPFKMSGLDFENYVHEWEEINHETAETLACKGTSPALQLSIRFIESIHRRKRNAPGCGVGRMLSVTPDGLLFLCQGYVGQRRYQVGDLHTGLDLTRHDSFQHEYLDFLSRCSGCWARNICGGACVAQFSLNGASHADELCRLAKDQLESIMATYDDLMTKCPTVLDDLFPTDV